MIDVTAFDTPYENATVGFWWESEVDDYIPFVVQICPRCEFVGGGDGGAFSSRRWVERGYRDFDLPRAIGEEEDDVVRLYDYTCPECGTQFSVSHENGEGFYVYTSDQFEKLIEEMGFDISKAETVGPSVVYQCEYVYPPRDCLWEGERGTEEYYRWATTHPEGSSVASVSVHFPQFVLDSRGRIAEIDFRWRLDQIKRGAIEGINLSVAYPHEASEYYRLGFDAMRSKK